MNNGVTTNYLGDFLCNTRGGEINKRFCIQIKITGESQREHVFNTKVTEKFPVRVIVIIYKTFLEDFKEEQIIKKFSLSSGGNKHLN